MTTASMKYFTWSTTSVKSNENNRRNTCLRALFASYLGFPFAEKKASTLGAKLSSRSAPRRLRYHRCFGGLHLLGARDTLTKNYRRVVLWPGRAIASTRCGGCLPRHRWTLSDYQQSTRLNSRLLGSTPTHGNKSSPSGHSFQPALMS